MIASQMASVIYMSKIILQRIVDDLHQQFGVELAICQVFKRRWSYVAGTEGFISGKHRIDFGPEYGIIVNCKDEMLETISNYIEERKVRWSDEESCNY